MRVFRSYWGLPKAALHAAAAIGNFDGVHRGHRALLERTREAAARIGAASAVITFEPHPREVLQPAQAPKRLTVAILSSPKALNAVIDSSGAGSSPGLSELERAYNQALTKRRQQAGVAAPGA